MSENNEDLAVAVENHDLSEHARPSVPTETEVDTEREIAQSLEPSEQVMGELKPEIGDQVAGSSALIQEEGQGEAVIKPNQTADMNAGSPTPENSEDIAVAVKNHGLSEHARPSVPTEPEVDTEREIAQSLEPSEQVMGEQKPETVDQVAGNSTQGQGEAVMEPNQTAAAWNAGSPTPENSEDIAVAVKNHDMSEHACLSVPTKPKVDTEREIAQSLESSEQVMGELEPGTVDQVAGSSGLGQGDGVMEPNQTAVARNAGPDITLYHYTTDNNAAVIRRQMLLKGSSSCTPSSNRLFGAGVYFTSLEPSHNPEKLVLNCFTRGGTVLRSQTLFRKIRYVVQITFKENKVEKIQAGERDVYLHEGDINLNDYQGNYKIYQNPYSSK